MKHKTFFGKLFGWIGDLFTDAAREMWNNLPDAEKESLKSGSNVVAIINEHIGEAPDVIVPLLKEQFPDIEKVEAVLKELCTQFNLTLPTPDLTGAIKSIQDYLASKEGTLWENISSILAQTAALIFSDGASRPIKIASLIEYVYRTFVKK